MAETNYQVMWHKIWQPIAEKHNIPDAGSFVKEDYDTALREAFNAYLLELYRDELRHQYRGVAMNDVDPLVIRVVAQHHWPIHEVEQLTNRELIISLADEINHFEFPDLAARHAFGQLRNLGYYEMQLLLYPHMSQELKDQLL